MQPPSSRGRSRRSGQRSTERTETIVAMLSVLALHSLHFSQPPVDFQASRLMQVQRVT